MGADNKPKLAKIMQTMKKAKLKPLEPYKTALTKWKCLHIPCGNVVYPKYNWIQQGQGGCGTCRYIKSGNSNRMPEKEAVAFMLKAGFKPLEPYKNSVSKWKCKCITCKSIVFPIFGDVRGGHGCVICGYKAGADKKRKDEKVAIQVMLDHGYQPLEPYKHSNAQWKCKCLKCAKIIYPTFGTVQYMDSQCGYCAGNIVDPKDAKKIMLASKLKPLEPYSGNNKKPWKCLHIPCGRVVSPTFGAVRSGQGGCFTCGKEQGSTKRKIPQKDAIAIMLKSRLKPLEPYVNNNTPWKCKCLNCGAIVTPMLHTVREGGLCIVCRPFGLNMTAPAYLYIISHAEFNSHKVGLGTVKKTDDRLTKFTKRGWIKYKTFHFKTGEEALKVEKAVFKVIRKDLKLPIYLTKEQMLATEGHTETVDADEITLLQLEKIIKKVIKGLKE